MALAFSHHPAQHPTPPRSSQPVTSVTHLMSSLSPPKTQLSINAFGKDLLNKLTLASTRGFPGGSVIKNQPAMQELQETQVQCLGWGRSPEGRNGNPFQDCCLENPKDRGPWWATVPGVTDLDMIKTTSHAWPQLGRGREGVWTHDSGPSHDHVSASCQMPS